MLKQVNLNSMYMYDKMTLKTVAWLDVPMKSVYKGRRVTIIDFHVNILYRLFQTGLIKLPNIHGEGT